MMRNTKLLACVSLIAMAAGMQPALAAEKKAPIAKGVSNQELLERIEKLEGELQKQKADAKSTKAKVVDLAAKAKDVSVDFKDSRPTFKTGDGRFSLALRARFQVDTAYYDQSNAGAGQKAAGFVGDLGSGTNVRRAYFGIEGAAFKDFWYEFRMDLGGSDANTGVTLNRARIAYHGIPHFRVNVGVLQPMMNYADTVSSGDLLLIERGAISNVTVDSFGGSGHRKGVELTFAKENMFYGGDNLILNAAYTGARTGSDGTAAISGHQLNGDEMSNVVGRAIYRAYSDMDTMVQFGGGFGRVLNLQGGTPNTITLQDRPEIRITGTRLVSTGAMGGAAGINSATTWSYDAQLQYKNFFLSGEYSKYEVDLVNNITGGNPSFEGWYVEGSWIITGQKKGYNKNSKSNNYGSFTSPKVVTPFSLAGNSWGVWELAARYSTLDLNYNDSLAGGVAGGEQKIIGLGVNWYVNNNVKLQVNDLIVNVDRRSAAGAANNFRGQNMNVIAARLQFSM